MAGATNAAAHTVGAGYIMQMIASETSDQIICSRTVGCTCVLHVELALPLLIVKSGTFLTSRSTEERKEELVDILI